MKKILITGASGTVGGAVYNSLKDKYELIRAGRKGADIQFDATDSKSIENAIKDIDELEGIITCFGKVPFSPFPEMPEEDFLSGMKNKFFGQVNIIRAALPKLSQGGSIVMTSGILSDQPINNGVCAAAVNGAINSFALALSLELKGRARVNVVSPSMVEASIKTHGHLFDGYKPTTMEDLVNAYRYCMTGLLNGKVIKLFDEIR